MKTLYLERSTGECRDGKWVEELDLEGVSRIVIGTGPGSFAGIRSALAFAQGYALAKKCEVLGLPSACAVAAQVYSREDLRRETEDGRGRLSSLAVVGDARQGKVWVALFDGFAMEREVFQVDQAKLFAAVPSDCKVVTPDAKRIDGFLRATFGERYLGGRVPTGEGLRRFAEANPAILEHEPLPIYLNPAVRPVAADPTKSQRSTESLSALCLRSPHVSPLDCLTSDLEPQPQPQTST